MENEILNEPNLQEEDFDKPKKAKFKTESGLFVFLFVFSVVFLISLYAFNIYISPIKVVGASMQPTINTQILSDSDETHCDVVYFKAQNSYQNGDIIIMANPNGKYINNSNVNFLIKRVVAKGGDVVKFIPKTNSPALMIGSEIEYSIEVFDRLGNKILSDESYIKEQMFFLNNGENLFKAEANEHFGTIFTALRNGQSVKIEIPENQYFVMGDNRNHSSDSRDFGSVDSQDIAGKVVLQVEYGKTIAKALIEKLK